MLNPGKKVSIVMCTYNGEQFIREQLDSILAQTYPIDEIIIVDDCSTDNTVKIIQEYLQQIPFIQFHQNKKNLGYTKNFEKALLLAKNELIAIADQDDIWHEKKIENLIVNWKEDTLLIYCDSVHFENNPPLNAKPNPKHRRFYGTDVRKLAVYNTVSGHAMMIKKNLLNIALPVNNSLVYDWWFAVVAAINGGVSYLPETLVYQRVHQNNATFNVSLKAKKERDKSMKTFVEKHLAKFIYAPNINAEDKKFFEEIFYLWKRSSSKKIDLGLFLFLIKYRKIIFNYKVRKIGFFSHLKHSFFFASWSYLKLN